MPRRDYTKPPVGTTFHRLTVLSYSHFTVTNSGSRTHYWNCQCACGTKRAFRAYDLVRGRTHGCGCYQRERVAETFLKHGECGNPEYVAWQNIKQRCLNSENREYTNYGERGITICKGWLDFDTFFQDVGARPEPNLSLDRKDNDGHYSCGHCIQCLCEGWVMNCRWATIKEQNTNRIRNPRALEYALIRKYVRVVDMIIAAGRIREGRLLKA